MNLKLLQLHSELTAAHDAAHADWKHTDELLDALAEHLWHLWAFLLLAILGMTAVVNADAATYWKPLLFRWLWWAKRCMSPTPEAR